MCTIIITASSGFIRADRGVAVEYSKRMFLKNKLLPGGPKNFAHFLYALQLHQILTNFQTFFTVRIRIKFVAILSLKIPPHLKCVATLPCEMSCLKAIFENKTFVSTHFKKLTTGNNVFIVFVIV